MCLKENEGREGGANMRASQKRFTSLPICHDNYRNRQWTMVKVKKK